MFAAALKSTHQSLREEEKIIKKAVQKIQWEDWEIFIKINHFHSVRIWDNKKKSTVKKFDESKFLHDIKT